MKQLSLRFKLYALVVSLLLIMGISIVVTAQLSLGDMEERLTAETRDTVQGIVMDQLARISHSAPTTFADQAW